MSDTSRGPCLTLCGGSLLRDEPEHAERRERELRGVGLVVPRHALGVDAAEVADVRAAVVGRVGVERLDPPAEPAAAVPARERGRPVRTGAPRPEPARAAPPARRRKSLPS